MVMLSKRETRRRLRMMAKAQVDMERGLYVWPDGRAPVTVTGEPVIEKKELMRLAGYSPASHDGGSKWFEDAYFLRHCQLERDKRDGKLPEIARRESVDGTRVLRMGKKMLDLMERRLEADPDSFSNTQLLQYTSMYIRHGLEMIAKYEGREPPAPNRQTFNTLLGDVIVGMDDADLERLSATQAEHASARMTELKAMIDSRLAAEEDADDPDVIDAEDCTESS